MFFSLFCFGQILAVSRPSWVMYVPRLNFKTCRFFAFLCRCHSFTLSLCHLPPFLLSYVAVSWPCCLSEFFLTGPLYPVFPPPPFLFFFCRGKNTYYSFPCILLPLVNIRQSCISNRLGFKKWHIPKKKKNSKKEPLSHGFCVQNTPEHLLLVTEKKFAQKRLVWNEFKEQTLEACNKSNYVIFF